MLSTLLWYLPSQHAGLSQMTSLLCLVSQAFPNKRVLSVPSRVVRSRDNACKAPSIVLCTVKGPLLLWHWINGSCCHDYCHHRRPIHRLKNLGPTVGDQGSPVLRKFCVSGLLMAVTVRTLPLQCPMARSPWLRTATVRDSTSPGTGPGASQVVRQPQSCRLQVAGTQKPHWH